MDAGKYKLVLVNSFNGCIVVCADSLAGLKEGYYEAKLSKLDKIHQPEGLVKCKSHPYVGVNEAVLASGDVISLRVDERTRWYGNHAWQIIAFDTAFHLIKEHTPEFFKKSVGSEIRLGKTKEIRQSSMALVFNKMQELNFGLKVLPDPLVRIALFEFAILAGVPVSDDTVITREKGRHYILDHDLSVVA